MGGESLYSLDLVNTGNKDATNVKLSVTTESDYVRDCEQYEVERLPAPVEASSTRILVKLGDRMRYRIKSRALLRIQVSDTRVRETLFGR